MSKKESRDILKIATTTLHAKINAMRLLLPKYPTLYRFISTFLIFVVCFVLIALYGTEILHAQKTLLDLEKEKAANTDLSAKVTTLENEDTRKTNNELEASISAVKKEFSSYVTLLEKASDYKKQGVDTSKQEASFSAIVKLLADFKWQQASFAITKLNSDLDASLAAAQAKLVASVDIPATTSQTPPGSGYSRQAVQTDQGTFVVDIIAADLSSTRILTDVGSDGDCSNNCTVMPLSDYVARNGGFAGINGSYFCPPDYPSCAGKVNSFDTLAFNSRTKKYSNSDNNVYSTVPMFVQNPDHSFRLMGRSLEWGRDTGIIGGLANYPILVSGSKAATTDNSKGGNKGFIGVGHGKVYIGHVHNATYGQAAKVLETLGLEQALNLDGGGSSALWFGGYKVGPGRLLPNAVILAH